jgi:hypothetical protein
LKKELRFHSLSTEDFFPLEGSIPTHIKPISVSSLFFPAAHTYEHHHNHLIDNITAHQAIVLTTCASLISLPPPRPTTGKTAIRVQDSLRSRKIYLWGETNRQDAIHEGFH